MMSFDAHCLAHDYERARAIAPYGDDSYVGTMTAAIVRHSPVLQTYKLGVTDTAHVRALLDVFDPPLGAHVLDAGCGVGAVASLMGALRPDLRFTLLNVSAAQLELAPAMPKIHADFQAIPVPAGSFDAAMYCYSLGHGLLDAVICEASRVLKPGGVIFIYDIAADDPQRVIDRLGYKPHDPDDIIDALWVHGFRPVGEYWEHWEFPDANADDFIRLFGRATYAYGFGGTRPIAYRGVVI